MRIAGYTYEERKAVLPALVAALENAGCWLAERSTPSFTQVHFHFEVSVYGIMDLYLALVGAGLELTRSSHLQLTSLCLAGNHGDPMRDLGRVASVCLEVSFLEALDLHTLYGAGAGTA